MLLVDDEGPIVGALSRVLRGHGFVVRTATTGADALLALSEEVPAVMLLDINLPDLTGWEVLRRMSPTERARVPVIVFSAAAVAPSRLHEFQPAGVLIKPFPFDALQRLLDRFIDPAPTAHHAARGS
ncbi:MAG: response regulator [Tepidiformaceae bacterium]